MEFRATRRKILAASGSVAGAVLAGVGGVFPESQLGSSGRPGDLSGISFRDLVIDELGSSEVEALVQRSRKAKGGEALWRRVSELGLQPDTSLARGMSAHFRQAPAKVGTGLTLMLRRDGMLAGRVAFGSDVEGKLRGGIAVVDPSSGAVDVHQLDGSAVNYRSRVTFANGEAIVDYADGRRKAVPLPKRQRPPGLAAAGSVAMQRRLSLVQPDLRHDLRLRLWLRGVCRLHRSGSSLSPLRPHLHGLLPARVRARLQLRLLRGLRGLLLSPPGHECEHRRACLPAVERKHGVAAETRPGR